MRAVHVVTLEGEYTEPDVPFLIEEPERPPRVGKFEMMTGAGRISAVKIEATAGGFVAVYIGGRLHSVLSVLTFKGLSEFEDLVLKMSRGQEVKMVGQADVGAGSISCMVKIE